MISRIYFFAFILLSFGIFQSSFSQSEYSYSPAVHSHNDYLQKRPFWKAFEAGAGSIEADIHLRNNEIYVAHIGLGVKKKNTLERLYLQPLKEVVESGKTGQLSILIDIKTATIPTLDKFIEILEEFPSLTQNDNFQIQFVISGGRPPIEKWTEYPPYILFDAYIANQAKVAGDKIAMFSRSFRSFSSWNGKGEMPEKDRAEIKSFIESCHAVSKPVRLWASPDKENAYRQFLELGLDFLNTDHPERAVRFIKNQWK